jgi:tetratricopeptide (TPR) repeat protein
VNEGERLRQRLRVVERDLEELSSQLSIGEIDEADGDRLRATYASERSELLLSLAAADAATAPTPARSRGRMLVGGGMLVVAIAVSIGLAGQFVQARSDGPATGLVDSEFDLDAVTNEQMEAVIAAYADDPSVQEQIPRMRLRLAERYFAEGDYEKAFDQYDVIIRSDPAPDIAAVSLTRVAWMVWLQTGDPAIPLELIDRSLSLVSPNPEAGYVKAQLLWCGQGEAAAGAELMRQVLDGGGLPEEVIDQIEADLAAATAGEEC